MGYTEHFTKHMGTPQQNGGIEMVIKTEKGQLPATNTQLPSGALRRELNHKAIIPHMAQKINKYSITIAISLGISTIITPLAVKAAYMQRGYFAFGGEYLIPILAVGIGMAIANAPEFIAEIKSLLDEAEQQEKRGGE